MHSSHDFARAYKDHYPEILRFLQSRLGGDGALAEDLAGEVFYKAWRGRASFTPGTSARAWLYRIARNTLIDYWRKHKEVHLSESELAELESAAPTLQSEVEQADLKWQLQRQLERLAGTQKSVVILRFIEGMNVRETAKMLGLSEGNVRVIQLRALQKLREFINEDN